MKKSKRLRILNNKLNGLKTSLKKLSLSKFNSDGSVNIDAVLEYNRKDTEVKLTLRKIDYVHQGKSYLGSEFVDITFNNK